MFFNMTYDINISCMNGNGASARVILVRTVNFVCLLPVFTYGEDLITFSHISHFSTHSATFELLAMPTFKEVLY